MKRKEFVRQLVREGCVFPRPGSRHDIYLNPETGQRQPVPRHREIENHLVKHIRNHLGLQ